MVDRFTHATALALYHTTVALGILLLPVALLARRVGLRLPVHQALERADRAYRHEREQ